jgi:hypothetical protein
MKITNKKKNFLFVNFFQIYDFFLVVNKKKIINLKDFNINIFVSNNQFVFDLEKMSE